MSNSTYRTLADVFCAVTGIAADAQPTLLVVGAGTGEEVVALRDHFANVAGIEPNWDSVLPQAKSYVKRGDAAALEYPDESLDFIYCYHVLEHIPEYGKALSEMWRVLKKGGKLYLGVPNKSRLFAYVCVKENSLKEKILWNLQDYRARLAGKFENRCGAHAGFTNRELAAILAEFFPRCEDVTDRYYLAKYRGRLPVRIISAVRPLKRVLWPSVYFLCTK